MLPGARHTRSVATIARSRQCPTFLRALGASQRCGAPERRSRQIAAGGATWAQPLAVSSRTYDVLAMMLPIMPWCRIDRVYQVGDITIYPYRGRLGGVDDVVEQRLARVLGTYRDIEGRPVDHAAVIL